VAVLALLTGIVLGSTPAAAAPPESVRAAYNAVEPPGLVREVQVCKGPGGPVYWVKNATGYEDDSVFFDAEGREIGRMIVPDTGPSTGTFDLSTLTGCETMMRRKM
jgi:hypothetical protein